MDDGKIIDMFFARNEDAIRHTDAAYGRRLYHLADRIVENGQDAEESVSDNSAIEQIAECKAPAVIKCRRVKTLIQSHH